MTWTDVVSAYPLKENGRVRQGRSLGFRDKGQHTGGMKGLGGGAGSRRKKREGERDRASQDPRSQVRGTAEGVETEQVAVMG